MILQHNFKETHELTDLAQLVGYTNCLNDFMVFINEIIECPGDFVNSNLLKETIVNTMLELKELHAKNEGLFLNNIENKLNT